MLNNDAQALIDLLPDLIFYKNMQGQYTHCNEAFLTFIEKTKEEIINKTDHELFDKINADAFTKVDKEILKHGLKKSFEEVFISENNQYSYFNTTKQVLFDEQNNKQGLFCIARNITTQKEYEIIHKDNQTLLEYIATENSLEKIFLKIIELSEKRNKETKCSILLLDTTGKYLTNGVAPSLPDFYNEAVEGFHIGEKAGSCGAAAFQKKRIIVSNIDTHENWQALLELTTKANLHSCWSEPIVSSNNEVLGTFAIYNSKAKEPTSFELKHISSFAHLASVAIEKSATLKLIKEKDTLLMNKSRIASIGEMLENVSHNWRQPLSIISTEASGMKLKKEFNQLSDVEFEDSIDNILDHTKSLSSTLDDFKKYSSVSNEKEWVFFETTLNKVIFILKATLETKNISVISNIEEIQFFTTKDSIIHLMINLLKNSCDAFDRIPNKQHLIFINAKQENNELIISIKDSANGIKEEILEKIFDPYFTTKHKSYGTGTGLYFCKEIVELQMSGSIEVENSNFSYENNEYKGALFTIKIHL